MGSARLQSSIRIECDTVMSSLSSASQAAPLPATYEQALDELEELVQTLESGQTPLDELLASYQRGAALLAFCKDKLAAVEEQIRVLDSGSQGMGTRPLEDDNA